MPWSWKRNTAASWLSPEVIRMTSSLMTMTIEASQPNL
jgi:hypothetical protein